VSEEDVLVAAERRVAWLRIAAVGLIVAAERLPHPNRSEGTFEAAAAAVFAYALVLLALAYVRRVDRRLSLGATALDVLSITVLAYLSGGPFSDARLAYFVIPISVAFRFGWPTTLAATGLVVLAYDVQAATHPARHTKHAVGFVAVQTGYLLWIGAAAALFSGLLAARTERLIQLSRGRRQLLADVMSAEERERRELAETIHDHAIQSLLAARQDLEEARKARASEDLDRALSALGDTVADLRGAIFELHPHVLQQAGLESALKAVAERVGRRGGFDVDFYVDYPRRHPDEALLLGAAREFLGNVARHARAAKATVTLASAEDEVVLTIADDGVGFDVAQVDRFVAEAHIGLLSQRERIEASGGRLAIESESGRGTTVTARLPMP
jgi:two-component system NarL family sensor kinase